MIAEFENTFYYIAIQHNPTESSLSLSLSLIIAIKLTVDDLPFYPLLDSWLRLVSKIH